MSTDHTYNNPADFKRETKYSVDHCAMARRLALLGLKDAEIAKVFDISLNRLMSWQDEHPEFGSALCMGRDMADATVAESLYKRAVGYEAPVTKVFKMKSETGGDELVAYPYMEHVPPDPAAGKFWLTARRPELWREQSHQAVSGTLEITGAGLSGLLAAARAEKKD